MHVHVYIHIYLLLILQVLTNSTCRRIKTESYVVSTINCHPDMTYQHLCLNAIVHFSCVYCLMCYLHLCYDANRLQTFNYVIFRNLTFSSLFIPILYRKYSGVT